MLTKEKTITTMGLINGSGKNVSFAESLAYFLKTIGYEITFKSENNNTRYIKLENTLTNFPIIEIQSYILFFKKFTIYIDKQEYSLQEFYDWLNKNFGITL